MHGFLPDESTLLFRVVWDTNLIMIGLTAVATWNLGAHLTDSATLRRLVPGVALALLAGYSAYVVLVSNRFLVAIAMYLPAT